MAVMMGVHSQTGFPVFVMPCYQHRFGKEMAPPPRRLLMVRDVCDSLGDRAAFRPWSYEIDQRHNGSTYELLGKMKEKYPSWRFHLVVGSDNIPDIMGKWDRGPQLVKENPVIIVDRPGYDQRVIVGAHPMSQHVTVGFPSASSSVREAIEKGDYATARRMVHPRVWWEIVTCNLYGHPGSKN